MSSKPSKTEHDSRPQGAVPEPGPEVLTEPTAEDLALETPPETPAAGAEAAPGESVPEGEGSEAAKRYKDRWLRAEAELQNYRRRAQREAEESRRFAEERVLLAWLEPLDDLERAIEAAVVAQAAPTWVEGVQLVAQRVRDTLAKYGVREIEAVGTPFDPNIHEALLEIDAPAGTEPGHVVQVARRGYMRDGRALRAARVVVARRPEA